MKPGSKRALWVVAAVLIAAGVATPKALTLLRTRGTAPAPTPAAGGNKQKEGAAKSGAGTAALRVSAVVVKPSKLVETVAATGTLRAEEGIDLQPEVNGKIVAINFTEGAAVKRGDLLVKLNDADLVATLQRAAYRRELAEIRERRLSRLVAAESVSQQDYEAALSELSVQRAEVALVEAQIAKTEMRAPFDGVIGLRFVSEGAFVNATTRIATLQRVDRLKLDFSVPEKYASRVRAGRSVTFMIEGAGKFSGEVYAVEPRIDAATRTVLIRAICPNGERRLLPGAFASVDFSLSEVNDALLVPATAVVSGLTEKTVFLVRDGVAQRRNIETGERTESSVHVTSGLVVGDVVVTSGLQAIRNGQPLAVSMTDGAVAMPRPAEKKSAGGGMGARKTGEGAAKPTAAGSQ